MATVHDGNGGPRTHLELPRKDLYKVGGFLLAVFMAAVGLTTGLLMFVFLPRIEAQEVHAGFEQSRVLFEQQILLTAEHKEEIDALKDKATKTSFDASINEVKALQKVQHQNTWSIMQELDLRTKPMPAGVKFDDINNP